MLIVIKSVNTFHINDVYADFKLYCMNIFVNQQPLNFELQEELSFPKILEHINQWVKEQKIFLLNYTITPKADFKDIEHSQLTSNTIDSIHFDLGETRDIYYESIKELEQYIDKLGSFLAKSIQENKVLNENDIETIHNGLVWISETLASITSHSLINKTEEVYLCMTMIQEVIQKSSSFNYNNLEEMLPLIESLAIIKNYSLGWHKIWQFYGASPEELQRLLTDFRHECYKALQSLDEIATDLTVGNEKKAMVVIEHLVDFLSDGLAIIHLNNTYKSESLKIVNILLELTNFLDNGDMANAADIIDYDLKEILEILALQN